MASISTELITYLKTIAGVTSLVGIGTAARIYKTTVTQGVAEPFIRIETFEGESNEYLGGIVGICSQRIQVDAYATTSEGAYALAEAIRLAPLQMFRGTMGSTTVKNVTSDESYNEGEDPKPAGSQSRRFYCSRDYTITYEEATS